MLILMGFYSFFCLLLKLPETCLGVRACPDLSESSQISEECRNLKEGGSWGCEQPEDKEIYLGLLFSLQQKKK